MIIKVCGVAQSNFLNQYQQEQRQTRYYTQNQNKETVKQDFGLVLDAEIKKLSINILIQGLTRKG